MASERWSPGDTGLTKEIAPGTHIMIGAEEAAGLGLRHGADGWKKFTVTYDPPSQLTLTEFLLARIAEDAAVVERRRGGRAHATHLSDPVSTHRTDCPDCLGLPGRARVLAECAAKRAIIAHLDGEPDGAAALRAMAAVYADHHDYEAALNVG